MSELKPQTIYLKDYTPPDFCIDTVHLHFDLHETETIVKTILHMRRNKTGKSSAPLVLNGEEMQLKQVALDGHLLTKNQYQVDDHTLTIPKLPDQFVLETEVIIKPQENTQLSGLYKSRNNFCTQCESHGFRRITYYLDRPDVMAHFTTTITADRKKYPILLSNGNLLESRILKADRHWVHWEDPSLKPCYLFALVAGDYDLLEDRFVTMSGRTIQLKLYLEKGYADQGDYALQSLKRAMKWDEETWGREYDLDTYMIVAVSDFNMGAMENKGLNIFNAKYVLAKAETATDSDYAFIENVIGHEYFHNWSGNRVTCRDWFQITLKEGLTVFRDQSFMQDTTSPAIGRLRQVNVIRNQQFAEDASPVAHPIRPNSYIEINNFYTVTVYRKGAEVIRMIQTLITPKLFRKGMDIYFSRHDGQAVTTEEFIKAMEDASGKDLSQFRLWYEQAGTPVLDIESDYNAAEKTYTLHVKQSCPPTPGQIDKKPFHLPLSVGLITEDCRELSSQSKVLEITKPSQQFKFTNIPSKPIPSLLRQFSAPVKINYSYSNKELALLLLCDTDIFTRWEASQRLYINHIGANLAMDLFIIETFTKLFEKPNDDYNLLAELLALPTINYLIQKFQPADVTAIHAARESFKHNMAKNLHKNFVDTYHQLHKNHPYHYSVTEMGKRSVKNICLAYLLTLNESEYVEMAYQQFIKSDNMTDTMGALYALNNHNFERREQALAEFYHRWQNEKLVIDKWLALQASSLLPDTLDKVKKLTTHPAYDAKNPNKIYALIGNFSANAVNFHQTDATGYQFLADQVLEIDQRNPQVAARLLQPLTQWSFMNEKHGQLMRQELQRIVATPHLSKDVFEVASKSVRI